LRFGFIGKADGVPVKRRSKFFAENTPVILGSRTKESEKNDIFSKSNEFFHKDLQIEIISRH
jgi:hypothetical protein